MTRFSLLLAAGVSVAALATAANAADLIIEEPMAPMVETYDSSWDGLYVGVFGGYGVGDLYDPNDDIFELDFDGNFIGGFVLGADFTVSDGIVLGIAGDMTYLGLEAVEEPLAENIGWDLYYGGSLRGRVGFDAGAFLPYLTAGVAFGVAEAEGSGTETGTDTNTHFGYTVGAGVEFAVTEDMSLDLLYKYTDYGAQDYVLDTDTYETGFTTHTISAGVNFRF